MWTDTFVKRKCIKLWKKKEAKEKITCFHRSRKSEKVFQWHQKVLLPIQKWFDIIYGNSLLRIFKTFSKLYHIILLNTIFGPTIDNYFWMAKAMKITLVLWFWFIWSRKLHSLFFQYISLMNYINPLGNSFPRRIIIFLSFFAQKYYVRT